ncbi:MAG: lysophospholipid acyltransferase family protein [Luteolibacter sp.]
MSEKPTPLTKRLQWRVECLFHSLIELVAAMLPGSWVFHIGECLGAVLWYGMPRRHRTVIRNLRIACAGSMEIDEIRRLAKASFVRSGANLLSAAHTASLSPSQLGEVIEVENLELLRNAWGKGKGVVLLLAHMGNWELLSRVIHFFPKGAKAGAMYRPLNNRYLDDRICARRQADGTRMFSKRDPFHQITGFLRDGGIVGVLVDQRVGINGDLVDFFGRGTLVSPLPSLLARRAKSEMLALSMSVVAPGKWKAEFIAVDQPYNTEHGMTSLEQAMKRSLTDVFWLQSRWRVLYTKKDKLKHSLGEDGRRSEKPHRALLWLAGMDAAWEMPKYWKHSDVVYEVAMNPGQELPTWMPSQTRIHQVEKGLGSGDYRRVLESINDEGMLPLDFLLADPGATEVFVASKQERLPAYSAV